MAGGPNAFSVNFDPIDQCHEILGPVISAPWLLKKEIIIRTSCVSMRPPENSTTPVLLSKSEQHAGSMHAMPFHKTKNKLIRWIVANTDVLLLSWLTNYCVNVPTLTGEL